MINEDDLRFSTIDGLVKFHRVYDKLPDCVVCHHRLVPLYEFDGDKWLCYGHQQDMNNTIIGNCIVCNKEVTKGIIKYVGKNKGNCGYNHDLNGWCSDECHNKR